MNIFEIVSPSRLTEIVNIGANPIGDIPPYLELLKKGQCKITGFEPLPDALETLNKHKSENERYFQNAIGDGNKSSLNICRDPGMSSLLIPNEEIFNCFPAFKIWGEVIGQIPVQSTKLDDLDVIEDLDFLVIDAQGSELPIFKNGRAKLKKTVFIQAEVSFIPLYKNQPLFSDIDRELREQGFIPHHFHDINRRCIAPLQINGNAYDALNQLFEADVVYVRNFIDESTLESEQLKHMALIADACYGSYDLAARCLQILETRTEIEKGSLADYQKKIENPNSAL